MSSDITNVINLLSKKQKDLCERVNDIQNNANVNITVESVDEDNNILSSQILRNNDTLRFVSTNAFGVSVEPGSVEVKFAPNSFNDYKVADLDYF